MHMECMQEAITIKTQYIIYRKRNFVYINTYIANRTNVIEYVVRYKQTIIAYIDIKINEITTFRALVTLFTYQNNTDKKKRRQ